MRLLVVRLEMLLKGRSPRGGLALLGSLSTRWMLWNMPLCDRVTGMRLNKKSLMMIVSGPGLRS
jgi:hypothetical protein